MKEKRRIGEAENFQTSYLVYWREEFHLVLSVLDGQVI